MIVDFTFSLTRFVCHCRARAGGGTRGTSPLPPTLFEKKKQRNTHFQIKGIFDGIRIFDWQTSPNHPIYDWSVSIRYYIVSLKTTIFTKLMKTVLSRRLPRFHQPVDVVQTMASFFIKVLKSPQSYYFLKQIELDGIVTT